MKSIIYYQFEDGDVPRPVDIREAFNLLYEFSPELQDEEHRACKAYHCVVDNKEFTRQKWEVLNGYGYDVARLAEDKYHRREWESAPWRDSILQSCARLRYVLDGLEKLVVGRDHQ